MIRVLIADDQALIREGFKAILEADAGIAVVGEAADGAAAVRQARTLKPDVVLMDIRMPLLDGIAATSQIASDPSLAALRVIIVTTYEMDENVYGALEAGAAGFLLKDLEPDDLRRAVRVVAAGDALLSPSVTRRLIGRFVASGAAPESLASRRAESAADIRLDSLTEREKEIVAQIASGLSNAQIAARLYISPTTVKTHASHAMLKLGARDRAQLVVFAYQSGLAG